MVRLKDLRPGDHGTVRGFREGAGEWKRKLLAMGMTVGTEFQVRTVGPARGSGGSFRQRKQAYLRKGESDALVVEKEEG
jgi:ferrous iron transport protein A